MSVIHTQKIRTVVHYAVTHAAYDLQIEVTYHGKDNRMSFRILDHDGTEGMCFLSRFEPDAQVLKQKAECLVVAIETVAQLQAEHEAEKKSK